MHCFGMLQGSSGTIAEERGYCVETDPDGDQAPWRMDTRASLFERDDRPPGPLGGVLGPRKDIGISMRAKATCQQSATGLTGWTQKCDLTR